MDCLKTKRLIVKTKEKNGTDNRKERNISQRWNYESGKVAIGEPICPLPLHSFWLIATTIPKSLALLHLKQPVNGTVWNWTRMQPKREQPCDKMLVAWIMITTVLAFSSEVLGNPVPTEPQESEGLTLRIVHTNDMHSRYLDFISFFRFSFLFISFFFIFLLFTKGEFGRKDISDFLKNIWIS